MWRTRLLAAAEAGPLDELGRARVDLLQAELAFAQNRGGDAPLLLLRAARKLETLDVRLSRNTYLDAWGAALFAGRLASRRRPARRLPRRGGRARRRPIRCRATCCWTAWRWSSPTGAPPRRPCSGARSPRSRAAEVSAEEMLRWGWLATRAANYVWDYDSGLEIGARAVRLARDSGALEVLAVADNACGQAAAFGGDFASADAVDRGGRCGQGGDRDPHRPARRDRAGGDPRQRGRGLRADRRGHRGSHRRRPGDRRPVRAAGRNPCS